MPITLYMTPTCPYCRLTKDWLDARKLEHTVVNVAADPSAANEMVQKSGQMGVPVLDVDGTILVGWNKTTLEELFKPKV